MHTFTKCIILPILYLPNLNKSKIGVQWTENIRGAMVIIDLINQFCQSLESFCQALDQTATSVVSAIKGTAIVVSIIGIVTAIYKYFSTGRGQI